MKMILKKKKKNNKLLIFIFIFLAVIFASFYFINYYSKKATPIIVSYAEAETKKLIILVINKAVTKQINNMNIDNIFDIKYSDNDYISTIDFNSRNTSMILSTITSLVELNLRAIEEGKIDMIELPQNSLSDYNFDLLDKGIIAEIPFGIVTGSSLLYNLGPKIPVKLSLVGDVSTGFSTDIVEYGINNAFIKLLVDVEVDTRIILPISSKNLKIRCSIPVAMKIIQGKIPEYYLNGFNSKSNIVKSK